MSARATWQTLPHLLKDELGCRAPAHAALALELLPHPEPLHPLFNDEEGVAVGAALRYPCLPHLTPKRP